MLLMSMLLTYMLFMAMRLMTISEGDTTPALEDVVDGVVPVLDAAVDGDATKSTSPPATE